MLGLGSIQVKKPNQSAFVEISHVADLYLARLSRFRIPESVSEIKCEQAGWVNVVRGV